MATDNEKNENNFEDNYKKKDYEDIIDQIGGFGLWQFFIFVSISFPDVFFSMAIMAPVFVGAEPSWICEQFKGQNYTFREDIQYNYSLSDEFNVNLTLGNITHNAKELCQICEKRKFNGEFTSIVSEWDLVCEKDYISDVISSIQMSGLLLGAAGFAQISDSWGRKKGLFASIIMLFVSGIASAFAVNWQMFAAFRFLLGVSTGGYYCIDCVYPMEFVNRRWRTLCGTIGFWAIGQSLLALLAYFIRDWDKLILVTTAPLVVYAVFWCWIPESPRWLAQHGRIEEAKVVFYNIASKNKQPEPDLSYLDLLVSKNDKTDNNNKKQKTFSYLHLFKTRKLAKITVITMLLWFVMYLTFYEISFNVKNLSGNRYLNQFYASIMDLSGMFYVLFLNNIIGRRVCLVTGIAGTICTNIALFVIFIFNKEDSVSVVVNVMAMAGKSFATAATYAVQIISAELFPTDIRNLGVGAGASSARIGSLLGPLLLYAGTHIKVLPYTVMGILSCSVLPLCFLLPETNGKPLVDDIDLYTDDKEITEKEKKPVTEITKC